MASNPVLELSKLKALHPRTSILLRCGTATIFRLSYEPTPLPAGTVKREISISWLARAGGSATSTTREIGWSDVPTWISDECPKWSNTVNRQDITEDAAIGVMAMLLPELENVEIISVLQIGSSADYLLQVKSKEMQGECSGIFSDPHGYQSTRVLKSKLVQVVGKSPEGFAAVTAFSHSANASVFCQLHYTIAGTTQSKKSKGDTANRERRRKGWK